jgi:hypothetical protein
MSLLFGWLFAGAMAAWFVGDVVAAIAERNEW